MILVLLGPPGSAKERREARIAVHYDIPTISTGAMFRDAVARGTELGRIIQRYKIEKGEYVPDEVVDQRGESAHRGAGLRRTAFCWTGFPHDPAGGCAG